MAWYELEVSDCTGFATYTAQSTLGEEIIRAYEVN